jgi:diacylglycerol kinase (ATP)
MGKRATLLVNTSARRVAHGFDPQKALRYLEERGIAAKLVLPGSGAEATVAARVSATAGDEVLFVLGGDGTVRDVARGLAGSSTALAALPGGTVNVWCREAGISRRLKVALDAHINGQVTRMDLGRAGGERFLLMASLGWDAAVTRRISPRLKSWLGANAYIAQAMLMSGELKPRQTRWTSGLAVWDSPMAIMVLANTRLYGGRVRFSRTATADDGMLDLVALCPRTFRETVTLAARLGASRLSGAGQVVETRLSEVTVETPGIPVQLDGDYIGVTPMRFEVEPLALAVSVPAGKLPRVFRQEG